MSRSPGPDPAPRFTVLRHPLFLGALALLLVNDHALKGAGILPGVLTGKLSDLAGLLVAPLFVAALAGARTPQARALAFAGVALPFTAIKLSSTAAAAAVALAGLFGVHARIWQDPTDLLALVMLLPAWRLADRAQAVSNRGARSLPARALERATIAVTGVACVATSATPGPGTYSTDAYIVNVAPHRVDVRVRWVDAELDCGALMSGDPTRMLGSGAFNLGITYRLEPHDTLPLERSAAYSAAGQGGSGGAGGADGGLDGPVPDRPCEVVLVEADRMPAMMLWWSDLPQVGVTANIDDTPDYWEREDLAAGRVTLMPPGAGTSGEVKKGPLRLTVAPSACADAPQSSIQWTSPSPSLPSIGILEELQEVPGGCLELTMRYPLLDGDPGTGGAGGGGTGGMDPGTGGTGGSGTGGDATGGNGAGGNGAGGSGTGGMDPGTGGAGGNGAGGNGAGGNGTGGAGGGDPALPDSQVLYLCVPLEDFPFVNGDEIQILEQPGNLSIQDFISTRRLEVYRDRDSVSLGGLDALAVSGACEGDRLPCGAYAQPAALSVATGGATSLLSPGEVLKGPGFHVRLGRAERVVVARDACGPGLDQAGISADFLVSWQ